MDGGKLLVQGGAREPQSQVLFPAFEVAEVFKGQKESQVYEKGSSQGGDLQTKTTRREAERAEGRALGRESSQTPRKLGEEMTVWICMRALCFLTTDFSWAAPEERQRPHVIPALLQPVLALSELPCRHRGGRGRSLPELLVAVRRIRGRALNAG